MDEELSAKKTSLRFDKEEGAVCERSRRGKYEEEEGVRIMKKGGRDWILYILRSGACCLSVTVLLSNNKLIRFWFSIVYSIVIMM
jgi:hypothetical protein